MGAQESGGQALGVESHFRCEPVLIQDFAAQNLEPEAFLVMAEPPEIRNRFDPDVSGRLDRVEAVRRHHVGLGGLVIGVEAIQLKEKDGFES